MTVRLTVDDIILSPVIGFAGQPDPKITSIVLPGEAAFVAPTGGETVTINGSGFNIGVKVYINNIVSPVVTFVSSSQITFQTTANAVGTYSLYIVNTNGTVTQSVAGITYST